MIAYHGRQDLKDGVLAMLAGRGRALAGQDRRIEGEMSRILRYTLSMTIDVPTDDDFEYEPIPRDRTDMERAVIQACRKLDGDVNAEVLTITQQDEDGEYLKGKGQMSLGYWTVAAIHTREWVTGQTLNTAIRYALACAPLTAINAHWLMYYHEPVPDGASPARVEVDLIWSER
jgi:hypothetical protein